MGTAATPHGKVKRKCMPQTKPKHEISILAEMSPKKKKIEKQSCFPCMGNALKTSLVGFQPHGAEKSPLGALTLGSDRAVVPARVEFSKARMASIGAQKKSLLLKPWMRNTMKTCFFVFTTIFDPLGLPHPLLKARHFGFFEIFLYIPRLRAALA